MIGGVGDAGPANENSTTRRPLLNSMDVMYRTQLDECRGQAREMEPEMMRFFDYPFERYVLLAAFVSDCLKAIGGNESDRRLLDMGPSFPTLLFSKCWPGVTNDIFGLIDPKFPPPAGGQHIDLDLSSAGSSQKWPAVTQVYGIIVMAEVIERFHDASIHVLRCLSSMLRLWGIHLVTTANAAALPKRLKYLAGQNPSELIHEDLDSAGHFREHLPPELMDIGKRAGWETIRAWSGMSASTNSLSSRVYRWASKIFPACVQKEFDSLFSGTDGAARHEAGDVCLVPLWHNGLRLNSCNSPSI